MAHAATAQGAGALLRRNGQRVARWMPALAGLAIVLAAVPAALCQQPIGPRPGPGVPAAPGEGGVLPQPKQITDLGPRTEALGAAQRVFGQPPVPTRYDLDKVRRYVLGLDDPTFTFEVIVGHTRLLHLKEAPIRIQIGDTRVFDYTILGPPTELLLQGASVGSTTMFVWFGDRAEPANQTILAFQINVLPDPDVKRRLEEVYKALQDEINKAFPDAYVCLTLVGDKLVVSGEVKDAIESNRVIQILTRGNASATAQNPVLSNPAGGTNFNLNLGGSLAPIGNFPYIPGIPEGQIRPDLSNYILPGESNIINLLRIPGEQQVMLKCTLASVNRTAAREIGLGFTIGNKAGTPVFSDTNGVTPNLPLVIDKGRSSLLINALRTNNMARNLAEPNVVALNGFPATIFSGGEFAVPVVTGATAVGLQGVSYIPFGVTLTFTPVITDRDRIRLTVNASVSALGPAVGSTGSPSINATTVTTEVEMREGQTFCLGGLLQQSLDGGTSRIPLFGDLPIAGNLFRSSSTAASENELVLLVTPQLVHPLEPNELPAVPGSDYFEPGDLEFYLLGRLESSRPYDYRSPVMNDINRMAAYRRCDLLYFVGPHGHSDGR
jgi:pilus assembly protein CpaC